MAGAFSQSIPTIDPPPPPTHPPPHPPIRCWSGLCCKSGTAKHLTAEQLRCMELSQSGRRSGSCG